MNADVQLLGNLVVIETHVFQIRQCTNLGGQIRDFIIPEDNLFQIDQCSDLDWNSQYIGKT